MALHTPIAVQPSGADPNLVTTAQEFRNHFTGMLSLATGFEGAEGVCGNSPPVSGAATGGFAVTQRGAGANNSVDVAAGHAYVNGDDISGQGAYQVWNDGVVNVTVPLSPPGTRTHRLVLQIQDKLSNATWTGYTAAISLLQDSGSGTPSQPNSAITLALITVAPSDVSVQNAAITDYRRTPGVVSAVKTSDQAKSNTSFSNDTGLQLWGLRSNAWYAVLGQILYNAAGPGTGDLKFTFNCPGALGANNVGGYNFYHLSEANNFGGTARSNWQDTNSAGGNGSGAAQDMGFSLFGSLHTGTTQPNNNMIFQFAQSHSSGTNTTTRAGSWLWAVPFT